MFTATTPAKPMRQPEGLPPVEPVVGVDEVRQHAPRRTPASMTGSRSSSRSYAPARYSSRRTGCAVWPRPSSASFVEAPRRQAMARPVSEAVARAASAPTRRSGSRRTAAATAVSPARDADQPIAELHRRHGAAPEQAAERRDTRSARGGRRRSRASPQVLGRSTDRPERARSANRLTRTPPCAAVEHHARFEVQTSPRGPARGSRCRGRPPSRSSGAHRVVRHALVSCSMIGPSSRSGVT